LLDVNGKLNIRNIKKVKETNEELYCIFNEVEPMTCNHPDCDKPTAFLDFQNGYRNYCSVKCSHNSEEVLRLPLKTLDEKIGSMLMVGFMGTSAAKNSQICKLEICL